MVQDINDPRRVEPPFILSERAMLEAWLEFHRTTLLLKCEGLDDIGRKSRPVPTSKLSLHGLVRHMAEVERGWFRRTLLNEPVAPPIWRWIYVHMIEEYARHNGHADLIRELVDGAVGW